MAYLVLVRPEPTVSTLQISQLAAIAFLLFAGTGAAVPPGPSDSAVYSTAYKAGRAAAQRDIRKGVLAFEDWGLPADFQAELIYRRILSERYGIRLRRIAWCEVDDKILGHGNGYNDVSVAEIERRFGHKLLDRVYAQAEKQARATR